MLSSFTDKFAFAVGLWPMASLFLTLPILAVLYHRDGRIRIWSACGAYLAVLYGLSLICFTLYPMPSGTTGLGLTYGIPPQLDPLAFIGDIRKDGMSAVFQIAANVAFFVPLGFIAGRAFGLRLSRALLLGFAVSLTVETAQLTGCFGIYPYAYRTFDVDDLAWNTAGAGIGWGCARLLARVLPAGPRGGVEPTRTPGFVRRMTAFCLDTLLVMAATALIGSISALVQVLTGSSDFAHASVFQGSWLFWIGVVVWTVVEGVTPWMRGGLTPGGGFVRMTIETRPRAGLRRALFYAARLTTFVAAFWWLPLAVPLLLLFYLVKRCMPYDLV